MLCADGRPIEVLAEATSVNVKKAFPMAYLYKHGKGHVFTTVLGHDRRALRVGSSSRSSATPYFGLATMMCRPSPRKLSRRLSRSATD